jgi:peroxiredoxin
MRHIARALAIAALPGLIAGVALAQQDRHNDKSAAEVKAEVGKEAPDFELSDSTGKAVKLSDIKDKIVVLEWINKACPVSHGKLTTMKSTAEKYVNKDVVWLAIDSTHGRTAAEDLEYAKENKLPYSILLDGDGAVGHLYGAKTTPHMFVIDKQGVLAYAGAIDNKKDRNYVEEAVDALLAGEKVEVATTKPYGCSVKYKRR